MSTVSLKNINKVYDNNVQAVFDFNLDISDKEFIVFVGPSGCGKSTTLRMVAGLEEITFGELYIDGRLVNAVPPKDRDIAMVFQSYALYPHMTVYGNMEFALKLRKLPMPLYEENEEVNALIAENNSLFKELHAWNRKFKRKQNNLELLEPRAEVLKKMYKNLAKIEKIRKPVMGINEYQIAKISKSIEQITNEIAKLENIRDTKNPDEQTLKIIENGVQQRNEQIVKLNADLEYYKNNETPLTKLRKLTAKEIEIEINKVAESIDLTRYLFRKPAALSGGQRQRVALGRAIVRKPKVFLMDEPLSNLDAKLRVQTRTEITKIHKKVGATTIYVTHDQTEAMTMADRIVIMKDGYIQQIGTPVEVYNDPANVFVGGFIGSPAMNFIKANIVKGNLEIIPEEVKDEFEDEEEDKVKETKSIKVTLSPEEKKILKPYEGKEIIFGIRPEDVHVQGDIVNANPSAPIVAECTAKELLGYELIIYSSLNGQRLIVKTGAATKVEEGKDYKLCFDSHKYYFFDKDTQQRIK